MNHFTNPQLLWLLLALPVLGALGLWSGYRKRRSLARLGNMLTLQRGAGGAGWRRWIRRVCLALALALILVGSAGPRWGRDLAAETVGGRDIVVVLDVSRSMLAEPISRQERAVTALQHLCDAVARRGGHRLALVVFAAHAEMACPLTHDYDHFRQILRELASKQLPLAVAPTSPSDVSGTRMGAALVLATQLHDTDATGAQDILLISDGDDPVQDREWQRGIDAALRLQIPVDVVGVGDPSKGWPIPTDDGPLRFDDQVVMTRLDERPLQDIASQTRGTYLPMRNNRLPLGNLYQEVLAKRQRQRDNDEEGVLVWRQRYAWFLGPALAFLIVLLLLGDGRQPRRRKVIRPSGARPSRTEEPALAG